MKLIQFINRYAHTIGVYSTEPSLVNLKVNALGRNNRKDSVAQIRDLDDATTMTYFFPKTDVAPEILETKTHDGAIKYSVYIARRYLSVPNKVGIRVLLNLFDASDNLTQYTLGYINCTDMEYSAETSQEVVGNSIPRRDIVNEDIYISDTAIVNDNAIDVHYIAVSVTIGASPTPDSFTLKILSDTTGYTPVTLEGVGMWPLTSVTTATLDPTVVDLLDNVQDDIDDLYDKTSELEDEVDSLEQEYVKR